MKVSMEATWPVTLRRWATVLSATTVVGLLLVSVESVVGISHGWRLLLNQVPIILVMNRVERRLR